MRPGPSPSSPEPERYAPAHGCESVLNAWCNANCPHAREHGPLLARLDRSEKGHFERAWRCYSRPTLDEDARGYLRGNTYMYCTRDLQLRRVLELCLRRTAPQLGIAVDVSAAARPVEQQAAPSYPVEPSSSDLEGRAARVGLVVARCHEEMEWLRDVQLGLREGAPAFELSLELYVYEKCGNRTEDGWPRVGWQHERRTPLPNKGEECLAYLTFLTELYSLLPDVAVFLQGDGVLDGLNFRAKFRAFSAAVFARGGKRRQYWRSVNDHQYISVGPSREACTSSGLHNCHSYPTGSTFYPCMAALYRRAWRGPMPRFFSVYANAQFGVTRDRVLARPLRFYEGLLREFDGEGGGECHRTGGTKGRPYRATCAMLEYLWPMLMGESNLLDPTHTMSGKTFGKRVQMTAPAPQAGNPERD